MSKTLKAFIQSTARMYYKRNDRNTQDNRVYKRTNKETPDCN